MFRLQSIVIIDCREQIKKDVVVTEIGIVIVDLFEHYNSYQDYVVN